MRQLLTQKLVLGFLANGMVCAYRPSKLRSPPPGPAAVQSRRGRAKRDSQDGHRNGEDDHA
jgi:hypothetical protein